MKSQTREAWLEQAVALMTPLFKTAGYTVPKVRVACGWPSSRGLSAKKRCLGECWATTASTDKVAQIFISPFLVQPDNAHLGVLPVLVHEVVHAVVGVEESHNKVFGKCARALGLEGKLTSTHAGPALVRATQDWLRKLGKYPHARLDSSKRPTKKQTTRMLKCECPECGYTARVAQKWIDAGAPICPTDEVSMVVDKAAGKDEGDDNE